MPVDLSILTPFEPDTYSARQKERLESLLGQIEQAAEARKIFVSSARTEALKQWLELDIKPQEDNTHTILMRALPDDRFSILLNNVEDATPEEQALYAELETYSIEVQKEGLGYVMENYAEHCDQSIEREHSATLASLYDALLTEFPTILNNPADTAGATELGALMIREKGALTRIWNAAASPHKLDKIREMLTEAYPEDEVDQMHIGTVDLKKAGAAFISSIEADTMMCGPLLDGIGNNDKSWDLGLYMVSHEFQHRRQLRLADKLRKGEIEEGTAEYFQARLFKANFEGGYITPVVAANGVERMAKMKEYQDQPVERQANNIACYASNIAGTNGAMMWTVNEKLVNIFSIAAKPADTISFHARKALRWLTGGNDRPNGPGLI